MKELFIAFLILVLTIKHHMDNEHTKNELPQSQNPLSGKCSMGKEGTYEDTVPYPIYCILRIKK